MYDPPDDKQISLWTTAPLGAMQVLSRINKTNTTLLESNIIFLLQPILITIFIEIIYMQYKGLTFILMNTILYLRYL